MMDIGEKSGSIRPHWLYQAIILGLLVVVAYLVYVVYGLAIPQLQPIDTERLSQMLLTGLAAIIFGFILAMTWFLAMRKRAQLKRLDDLFERGRQSNVRAKSLLDETSKRR